MTAVAWVLSSLLLAALGCIVALVRYVGILSAAQESLLDRIQAPEAAALSAAARFSPPRTKPASPTHRTIRGRAGVGVVRVPINQSDEDIGEEMGG